MTIKIKLLLLLFWIIPVCTVAQERGPVSMSFSMYPYLSEVNSDTDLTITTSIPLTKRLAYFSFINLGGLLHSGDIRFSVTEQNIIWNIVESIPVDFVAQDTIRRGHDNDTIHLGLRWRVNNTPSLQNFFRSLNLSYNFIFFPARFDQRKLGGWQLSHNYRVTFPAISERLYLSGFLDHNLNERVIGGSKKDYIISESQLGVRLINNVFAVLEYRYNEYRRTNRSNLGAGIEIKASW